jgi:hypothetical protein
MKLGSIDYALLHSSDPVNSDPLGAQFSHDRLSPRLRSSWRKMMQHDIISPCVPDIQDNDIGAWGYSTI